MWSIKNKSERLKIGYISNAVVFKHILPVALHHNTTNNVCYSVNGMISIPDNRIDKGFWSFMMPGIMLESRITIIQQL